MKTVFYFKLWVMPVVGSTRSLHVREIEKSASYCRKCGDRSAIGAVGQATQCAGAEITTPRRLSRVTPPRSGPASMRYIDNLNSPTVSLNVLFPLGEKWICYQGHDDCGCVKRTRYLFINFIVLEISLTVINPKRSLQASGGHAVSIEVYGMLRHEIAYEL